MRPDGVGTYARADTADITYMLTAVRGTACATVRCNGRGPHRAAMCAIVHTMDDRKVVAMADDKKPHETLRERFDDFKEDVDIHKAEHQQKDALKDVDRAAKHEVKSDVDLDKAADEADKAVEREEKAQEG